MISENLNDPSKERLGSQGQEVSVKEWGINGDCLLFLPLPVSLVTGLLLGEEPHMDISNHLQNLAQNKICSRSSV